MEPPDMSGQSTNPPAQGMNPLSQVSSAVTREGTTLFAQAEEGPLLSEDDASGAPPMEAEMVASAYVYALGRVEPRFPRLAVEKELAQATGHAETAGLTDRQALHAVLSQRQNRYLVRQLCWVFTIEGLETYLLQPRDPVDLELLVEAVRPGPRPTDVDVVIGMRGPLAPPELCNGLMVPIVVFDQIYSFDMDDARPSHSAPRADSRRAVCPTAEELSMRIMQMADNAGATDEHRALNYLAVRYPAIYAATAELLGGTRR